MRLTVTSYVSHVVISSIAICCILLLTDLKGESVTGEEVYASEEPSKLKINKRSYSDENGYFDLHIKSVSRQSQITLHLTSPKAGYEERGKSSQREFPVPETVRKEEQYPYKVESDSEQSIQTDYSISYVGCFATWEKQYSITYSNGNDMYNESHTQFSCAYRCRNLANDYQVSFLKGGQCACSTTFGFNSTLIDDRYCNIPCPVKDYDPSAPHHQTPRNSCGGNLAYSVYCRSPGSNDCSSLVTRFQARLEDSEQSPKTKTDVYYHEVPTKAVVLEESCTKCDVRMGYGCEKHYFHPDFDYFPTNSPSKCAEYCGRNVSYVASNLGIRIREPTAYAMLTWWEYNGQQVCICRCVNENIRERFIPTNSHECNVPCPGNSTAICGGLELDRVLFATIYCVDDSEGSKCLSQGGVTTSDPCLSSEIGCEDPGYEPEPTTPEDITGTTDDSVNSSTTLISSTPEPTTTTPVTTTTLTPITTTKPSNESERTTTSPSTTTSTRKPTSFSTPGSSKCPSNRKCRATDRYGYLWSVCINSVGIEPCWKLTSNSVGVAFWSCSQNETFATSQPDVSNCSSSWLEHKHNEVEHIENIKEADQYIDKLAEACKNAQKHNSSSEYFGHEIKNITFLVDLALSKAREFYANFNDFELIVEKAADLNAFLIQYHDPWKDLNDSTKSSLSTSLLENTEESLFHLTEVVMQGSYQKVFIQNSTDFSHISVLLAETFEKNIEVNSSYEFPPVKHRTTYDSYIKLPRGWHNIVPDKKISIAGMSFDSSYISYVMPGQYSNLEAGANANPTSTKLINGRLISLTVSSNDVSSKHFKMTQGQPSFPGKGVEIVFQHDTEAWGDETQDVPRKLHPGEKPKAVLGSTQCVYWDTKSHSWSSKGCKIVSSNRFETVCECSHLTSFAILMDVHKYVGKQFALELLTLILCPLSQIALVLSFILLSSVNGLQKIRATITKNLSLCLFFGNTMVMFVLDRNYFDMSEGVCTGAAIVTHYIFLCAFMWMMIEGVQLYRMVIHVFDSGRSYIKHFGLFAYGSPLILVAITALTGYLKGDKPYGGDIYCWLDGSYIWSFMAPVALVTMVNLVVLFIALKTAYQLQQNKKLSPTFMMGRIRSYRTWFKGCISLTIILGLTWVVGFFTLMKSPSGIVAAYIFTLLNASQGMFIFLFHCILNDKVRSFTQRNLSTYLPSWLTSSVSSTPGGNDASVYVHAAGKRPLSSIKSGESGFGEQTKKSKRRISSPVEPIKYPYIITRAKSRSEIAVNLRGTNERCGNSKDDIQEAKNVHVSVSRVRRCESAGTISSVDSIHVLENENGHISSDASLSVLISKRRSKEY